MNLIELLMLTRGGNDRITQVRSCLLQSPYAQCVTMIGQLREQYQSQSPRHLKAIFIPYLVRNFDRISPVSWLYLPIVEQVDKPIYTRYSRWHHQHHKRFTDIDHSHDIKSLSSSQSFNHNQCSKVATSMGDQTTNQSIKCIKTMYHS